MGKSTKPRASGRPPLTETFGMNVRVARVRQRLSQEALAEAAGTNQTRLSLIERGKVVPGLDVLERIARALKLPPSILLDEGDGVK